MAEQPKGERRRALEQERGRVQKGMDRLRVYLEDLRVAEDGADPDASERMMSLSIMGNLERRLQSIDYALSIMDRGEDELCERCRQPIEPERLKVLPDTTLCVKCKIEMEREG